MVGPEALARGFNGDLEGPVAGWDANQLAAWDRLRSAACAVFAEAAGEASPAAGCWSLADGCWPAPLPEAALAAARADALQRFPLVLCNLTSHLWAWLAEAAEAGLAAGQEPMGCGPYCAAAGPPVPPPPRCASPEPMGRPPAAAPPQRPLPGPLAGPLTAVVCEGLRLAYRLGAVSGCGRGGHLVIRVPPGKVGVEAGWEVEANAGRAGAEPGSARVGRVGGQDGRDGRDGREGAGAAPSSWQQPAVLPGCVEWLQPEGADSGGGGGGGGGQRGATAALHKEVAGVEAEAAEEEDGVGFGVGGEGGGEVPARRQGGAAERVRVWVVAPAVVLRRRRRRPAGGGGELAEAGPEQLVVLPARAVATAVAAAVRCE
ncbi:hypothetical protein GPECTOR_88g437 [Gonium pectorale]|uniref:Uncharacterized protein n=1 Tax=Gonium pectorale TaxID=33097 RepID=A0A150G1X1_GONPE|nr:hypothetical protein GPECTOR_88g437 [Gonium pectorale]|eukprot:KXZ43495.1 hypothetical protein GPECTOR_88g437 [Gonium pectorale]